MQDRRIKTSPAYTGIGAGFTFVCRKLGRLVQGYALPLRQ